VKLTATRSGDDPATVAADAAAALRAGTRAAGRTIGREGRRQLLAAAKSRRGSLRFSNMGGARLNAKPRVFAGANYARVVLTATPAGPWAIAETGSNSHTIRARRTAALTVAGDYYAMVQVSGVGGRGVWTHATGELEAALLPEITSDFDAALGGV
jgi:hypothetical protein